MYRPANYYAARTAAIKKALEEDRARTGALSEAPQKTPAPYSVEALRDCGRTVDIMLGVFFGDLKGTVVKATFCYALSRSVFLAMFELDGVHHVVECFYYNKRDDLYNYAYSEIAAF